MYSMNEKPIEDSNKKTYLLMSAFSLFFVLGLIHLTNWDRHSFTIVPLKAQQMIGLASAADLRKIADICTERLKYDCVDSALSQIHYTEITPEDYLRIGDLRRKLGRHKMAVAAYSSVLNKKADLPGNLLADTYYGLAKSSENLQQIDNAIGYYEKSISAKPDVIQITVTEAYLKLLQQAGRPSTMQKVIAEARRRGGSDRLFSKSL
ncbi:MAG: hypothetical protein KDD38_09665 [Bdellovibrionales bacterium]|nr:hypothetical protein [Bdellovibrionales bacterium]